MSVDTQTDERQGGNDTMYQSLGSWMLTGGTRGELDEEARQLEHLRAFREMQSERRAVRRAEWSGMMDRVVGALRARVADNLVRRPAETTPDCCAA